MCESRANHWIEEFIFEVNERKKSTNWEMPSDWEGWMKMKMGGRQTEKRMKRIASVLTGIKGSACFIDSITAT